MKYTHFWHFNKNWYAEVTESPETALVYWHNSSAVQDSWNEKYLIEDSTCLTERQVRAKLKELYPDYILIKDKPFHEGRRWRGNKEGSRG